MAKTKPCDFMIVFTSNVAKYRYKRFLISHRQLSKYIGLNNANKALCQAQIQKVNKTTLKFRKFGKIEIYLK